MAQVIREKTIRRSEDFGSTELHFKVEYNSVSNTTKVTVDEDSIILANEEWSQMLELMKEANAVKGGMF